MRTHSGLSMAEVIIGIGILGILMLGIVALVARLSVLPESTIAHLDQEQATRSAVETMIDSLRRMNPSDTGAYPIEAATATSVTFYVNMDADNARERVRYFVDGAILKRGITKATGTPSIYDSAEEKIETIVRGVQNTTPIFEYYNGTYAGAEPALSAPIPNQNIRYISVTLTVDEDPTSPPGAFTLRSGVTPRALKDNL